MSLLPHLQLYRSMTTWKAIRAQVYFPTLCMGHRVYVPLIHLLHKFLLVVLLVVLHHIDLLCTSVLGSWTWRLIFNLLASNIWHLFQLLIHLSLLLTFGSRQLLSRCHHLHSYVHLSSPKKNCGFFFTRIATEPLTLVSGSYSTAKAGKPLTTPWIMNRGWRHTLGIFSVSGNTQVCLPTSASWSPCLLTQGGLDEGSIHHIPDTSLGGAVLLSNLDNQRHLGPCVPLDQAFFLPLRCTVPQHISWVVPSVLLVVWNSYSSGCTLFHHSV